MRQARRSESMVPDRSAVSGHCGLRIFVATWWTATTTSCRIRLSSSSPRSSGSGSSRRRPPHQ
eukprot:2911001-Prymnesium_polylepis.1